MQEIFDFPFNYSDHSNNNTAWYAVRVRTGCEKRVGIALQSKQFCTLVPLYQVRHRWSDRYKIIDQALFPGYLFCRLDLNDRIKVLESPAVIEIVSAGKKPVPVDEKELKAISDILAVRLPVAPWGFAKVGQKIRLTRGPLAGLEGELIQVREDYRLVVGVSLLQRSIAVEIDADWAVPATSVRFANGNGCSTFPGDVERPAL